MISSKCKKQHLLAKLYNRQLYGQFTKERASNYEPARQLFSSVPPRLIYPLRSIIPNIGNHILMGATKCGKFLITYSFSLDPFNELSQRYSYTLHFWSFIPGKQARMVAEVQLFNNKEIQELLTITIVQWPNVPNQLIVFGNYHGDITSRGTDSEEEGEESRVYVTVTSTPCPQCVDCLAVASSYSKQEGNSLPRSCRIHGLTFHTWFSLPYYYECNPNISCCIDRKVILNTGSFVHVLEFSVNEPPKKDFEVHSEECPPMEKPKTDSIPIVDIPLVNRLSYYFLRDNSYMITVSDTWVNKMLHLLIKWINFGHQVEIKYLPFYLKFAIQKHSEEIKNLDFGNLNASRTLLSSDNVIETLYYPCLLPKPKWFSSDKTNRISHAKKQANEPPDKVYDFKEDGIESCPRFDAFRRRCLANKVYDFSSDEERNLENIMPININGARLRSRHNKINYVASSIKETARDDAIMRFIGGLAREPLRQRKRRRRLRNHPNDWMGPHFEIADEVLNTMDRGFGHQPAVTRNYSKHLKKTYEIIQLDGNEEILGFRNDIDDDEIEYGLPMFVQGGSCSQMGRVSEDKVSSLNVWSVEVAQSSLDVERICFVAGETVCKAEKLRFNYITDYDTEIVQTCALTGDILMVLFIRLSADKLLYKKRKTNEKTETGTWYKKPLYDCQVLIIWSPVERICYLEGHSGLTEVCSPREKPYTWAASVEARRLRPLSKSTFGSTSRPVKFLVHNAIDGHLDSSSLILDHDNLIGFRKI